jgi:haloalkane dehalogenase
MRSTTMNRRAMLRVAARAGGAGMVAWTLPGCGGSAQEAAAPPTSDTPAPVPTPVPSPTPTPTPTATPTQSFLKTPPERFAALADFPYTENYASIAGMRMHYVDAGPRDAVHTFLCLHGQPTWSYLYRKMIPVFTAAGHRVIAPDWFGFGKSDKPISDSTYTFNFHRETMLEFVRQLDLRNVTLVVQDWGGLLGLTIPPAMPERFVRLIIMNTTFATGAPLDPSQTEWAVLSEQRRNRWLAMTDVDIQRIMLSASPTATQTIAAAYDAPFPDPTYEAGARRFPVIVPITPEEEGAAISRDAMTWWGTQWNGPTFMAIGMQDNLLGPEVMNIMKTLIRNCPAPLEVPGAGHFIQEDAGTQVAQEALRAFG